LTRLGLILTKFTPDFIQILRKECGVGIFSKYCLEKGFGEVKSFNGINQCRLASRIIHQHLREQDISGFSIFSDSLNQHHFLHNPSDIFVDGTWKQFFSFSAMDAFFSQCLHSDNP
jgi:hypothetical protein